MRKRYRQWLLLGLLLVIAVACAGQTTTSTASDDGDTTSSTAAATTTTSETTQTTEGPPQELTRLTYRLDFLAGPPHIPFVWGVVSGIYEKHGLDLRVLEGRGSALTFQIVASGADPLGNVDGGVYALGKADTPEVGIMVGVFTQDNPADLLFACDQNIDDPTDLAGKTLAAAPGDAVVALLPAMLSQFDMSLDDLNVVSVAPAARVTAVIEGDADIGVGYGHASSVRYILAGRDAGIEICSLRLSEFGVTTLGHGSMVNQQFLEQNPDVVRAFVEATQEAIESTAENFDAAVDAMIEYFPTTASERETMEIGLEVFLDVVHSEASEGCPIGWIALEDADRTIDLLTQYLELETDLPSSAFYTNDFTGECEGKDGV